MVASLGLDISYMPFFVVQLRFTSEFGTFLCVTSCFPTSGPLKQKKATEVFSWRTCSLSIGGQLFSHELCKKKKSNVALADVDIVDVRSEPLDGFTQYF